MRVLVTGGAGFVGSHLAKLFRKEMGAEVHVLDNLKRRGSETNLPVLKEEEITFHHGDIRNPSDIDSLPGDFDVLLECSAEPSVFSGAEGSPRYVIDTNLLGTVNCLEFARRRCKTTVFLSTSRVYSIQNLCSLPLEAKSTRLELPKGVMGDGFSFGGIAEGFSTQKSRTFYGASKLAAEILCQEYSSFYSMNIVINRCGVIAGPGQFGKADQGVFSLWVAHHLLGKPLRYTGFGGKGLQVRDLLHPQDLFTLIRRQVEKIEECRGEVFNVGGGRANSVSLKEYTAFCERITAKKTQISSQPTTANVDVPYYLTDNSKVSARFQWEPQFSIEAILEDTVRWMSADLSRLKYLFG